MSVKVYIAGASADIERVERIMAEVRKLRGVEITYDWTKPVREHGSKGTALSRAQRWHFAHADRNGIREAEVVWFLLSAQKSEGRAWELGYAQALMDMEAPLRALADLGVSRRRGRLLKLSVCDRTDSPAFYGCIFNELPASGIATDEQALAWLKELGEDHVQTDYSVAGDEYAGIP